MRNCIMERRGELSPGLIRHKINPIAGRKTRKAADINIAGSTDQAQLVISLSILPPPPSVSRRGCAKLFANTRHPLVSASFSTRPPLPWSAWKKKKKEKKKGKIAAPARIIMRQRIAISPDPDGERSPTTRARCYARTRGADSLLIFQERRS